MTPSIEGIAPLGLEAHPHKVDIPLGTPSARHAYARIQQLSRESTAADDGFLAELSRQLCRIVPFEASFWAGTDPGTLLAISPSRIENLDELGCDAFWEGEYLVEDFIRFSTLARSEQPAASLFRATDGHPARSHRYRGLIERQSLGDELRGVFRSGRAAWGFVSLYRGDGDQPFSPAEERLLARLSTTIGDTFRRSALLRPDRALDPPDAPGLLMFDRTGKLELLNAPAEAWLRELPVSRFHEKPTEMLNVVTRARAIAAGHDSGDARVRVLGQTGRWLVIHAFALLEGGVDSGKVALVIEPAKAAEIAPIITEAYQLGPREQQVTSLVARGLSTNEIAAQLSLSAHTVRDYLKQVFEKVGVTTRGELVAKIFAEHYTAPLHADMQIV